MTAHLTLQSGDGTVSALLDERDDAVATVVLAHGAGSGMDHPFLAGVASGLAERRIATLRFSFAYREAGRRLPDRPPAAVAVWRAAMDAARELRPSLPVWAAGKSYGGRMASLAVAEGMAAAGLVFLGYPLHPPGKPAQLRDAHLYGLTVPMLFLQGTRDPFATPDLLEGVVRRIGPHAVLQWVEGGNHSFEVAGTRRPAFDIGAALASVVAGFVLPRR